MGTGSEKFKHLRGKVSHVLLFSTFFSTIGTMWLCEIVWQIQHDGLNSNIKINKRVPFFEGSKLVSDADPTDDRPAVDTYESPRLLHSHLPYHLIPMSRNEETRSKYIYIARNPKDVVVSLFHFLQSFGEEAGFKGPFEFMAKIFLEGKGGND